MSLFPGQLIIQEPGYLVCGCRSKAQARPRYAVSQCEVPGFSSRVVRARFVLISRMPELSGKRSSLVIISVLNKYVPGDRVQFARFG